MMPMLLILLLRFSYVAADAELVGFDKPDLPDCDVNFPDEMTDCKQASEILADMDFTQAPCDYFYNFSCNNWDRSNPKHFRRWRTFKQQRRDNDEDLLKLLEEGPGAGADETKGKIFRFQKMCKTTLGDDDGDKLGQDLLRDFLNYIMDTDDSAEWNEKHRRHLARVLARTHGLNSKVFFAPRAEARVLKEHKGKHPHKYALAVKKVDFDDAIKTLRKLAKKSKSKSKDATEERENYTNNLDKVLEAYTTYIRKDSDPELGKEKERKDLLDSYVDFEMVLAKASEGEKDLTTMDIDELQEKYPFMDWSLYFKELFSFDSRWDTQRKKFHFRVDRERYLETLKEQVQKEDPKKIMQFVGLRVLYYFAKNLPLPLKLPPIDASSDSIAKQCLTITDGTFGFGLGKMMIEKTDSSRSAIKTVRKLFETIKNIFERQLTLTLSGDTKERAVKKVQNMEAEIGVPEFVWNVTALRIFYEDLAIDESAGFVAAFNESKQFIFRRNLKQVLGPLDFTTWPLEFPPDRVNAFYEQTSNWMYVLMGAMHPPFYWLGTTVEAFHYGPIGAMIAHEMSHAFDSVNINFDADGYYKEVKHSSKDSKKFTKFEDCIENHYSKFFHVFGKGDDAEKIHVNGTKTQAENMADVIGVHIAYEALKDVLSQQSNRYPRPYEKFGLNFTHGQLYWVAFAQLWCDDPTTETLKRQLEEEHAPGVDRIKGVYSSLEEFSDDWNCAPKDALNPKKKCLPWLKPLQPTPSEDADTNSDSGEDSQED